jgi:methyl-accepting chemotaxis protein
MTQQDVTDLMDRIDTNYQRTTQKLDLLTQQLERLDHITADLQNHTEMIRAHLNIGHPKAQPKINILQDLQTQLVARHNENRTHIESLEAKVNQLAETSPTNSKWAYVDTFSATLTRHATSIQQHRGRLDDHQCRLNAIITTLAEITETLRNLIDKSTVF